MTKRTLLIPVAPLLLATACGRVPDDQPDARLREEVDEDLGATVEAVAELIVEQAPAPLVTTAATTIAFRTTVPMSVRCRLDGAPSVRCESPWSFEVAEGDHVVELIAVGTAETAATAPQVFHWTVDLTPPETVLLAAPAAIVQPGLVEVGFESPAADAEDLFSCALDGAAPIPCHSPLRLDNLALGPHRLVVAARDRAGLLDPTPLELEWQVGSCGDALLGPGEACDDGNSIDGDGCTAACREEGTVRVRAFVDGRSQLVLDGQGLRWHHLEWAAPGREFGDDPTFIDGEAWMPWEAVGPGRLDNCGCDSSLHPSVPPLATATTHVGVRVLDARGVVTVLQQPAVDNGGVAIIDLDDTGPSNSYWYELELTYQR